MRFDGNGLILKKILIIGIGAGNPEYITVQAINALNRADVFFLFDKGSDKSFLNNVRKDVCERYIDAGHPHRFVEAFSPEHNYPSHTASGAAYRQNVDALNRDKQGLFERLISQEMVDGECGAFLVWGDPALYDSTLRNIEVLAADARHEIDYEVIPGISSVQALAAQHRVPLNRIGEAVTLTTGRKLAEGFPDSVGTVVVLLDAENVYARFADQDIDIHWGAYIGTPDEILISGPLREVKDEILRVREEARRAHGWIMDSYMLRRRG